ncbi:hypothetical protein Pd630_LPD09082 (plasmid) [Rhodococcus opacus PD630]|nr:hypothetical protein Pd630_LPD09082 [Rhodococcus opacus PD630]
MIDLFRPSVVTMRSVATVLSLSVEGVAPSRTYSQVRSYT